ncbi:MAG: ABC transporter ATP-binding protein [Armatimonadota bacterium]|nr:ABC transporter ATP-binding protein [Armatimonadota bacterium]
MILQVSNLTKAFGGVVAVKNLSFEVSAGERLGIIGPNGAGKTTTFNVIGGEYRPTAGSVHLDGERIDGLKPHDVNQRGIARTFQIVRVFGQLTVHDHVLTGLVARRPGFKVAPGQEEEVDGLLALTGLQRLRDVEARNLTTAYKKRLELATALATKPKLLLLDELMAGLNLVEIDESMQLLRRINEEMRITLLIVEHVMRAIMGLCHRIIVLHYGEKIAEGTPQEVAGNRKVIDAYLGEEAYA